MLLTSLALAIMPLIPQSNTQTIIIRVGADDFNFCHPVELELPTAAPGLKSVRIDCGLAVDWRCNAEITLDGYYGVGYATFSWDPEKHGGQPWPSQDDLGKDGDSYCKYGLSIHDFGINTAGHTKTIHYARNDKGDFPRGPFDNRLDGNGKSGGHDYEYDPMTMHYGTPLYYQPVLDALMNGENLYMHAQCSLDVVLSPNLAVWLRTYPYAYIKVVYEY